MADGENECGTTWPSAAEPAPWEKKKKKTLRELCFVYTACPRAVFVCVAGVAVGGACQHDVTFGQ